MEIYQFSVQLSCNILDVKGSILSFFQEELGTQKERMCETLTTAQAYSRKREKKSNNKTFVIPSKQKDSELVRTEMHARAKG